MTNIEVFNRITAEVFKQLYASFPKPITLSSQKLREEANITDADWSEDTRGIKGNPASYAINWLHDEGFIRGLPHNSGSQFANAVLTTKALTALSKVPESVDSKEKKETLGERFKELSKTATTEAVSILVKSVFSDQGLQGLGNLLPK